MPQVLANGVGGALIPMALLVGFVHRLLSGQELDEAAAKMVEAVGAADMPVETHRFKLRKYVDLVDLAVDAVRDGDVDESILAGERHGWLRAVRGERQQARPTPTAQI